LEIKTDTNPVSPEESPSEQIDAIIAAADDWRGKKLALLRAVIKEADPDMAEEVKWKMPSNPRGVPVWTHPGNICIANILKNAVRLTFPNGAELTDPQGLFNTRLDSKTVRAVDFHENDPLNVTALKAIILEAVELSIFKHGG
jgi:hypothetical protein